MTSELNEVDEKPGKINYKLQYVIAFSGTLIILSVALTTGWTSPTLPLLMGDNSPIPITPDESSWITAFLVIGICVGPIPTAWMVDKYGRKISLLIAAVPLIIGWILIIVADSIIYIYLSRILGGIGYGIAYSVTPMYLGEIASDSIRGSIGTLLTVMAKLGIVYVYATGPYVSFSVLGWLCIIPPIIFLVIFIWMPESPYFLVRKDKNAAFKSLVRLRGHNKVSDELDMIDSAVKRSRENKGTVKELFTKGNFKSILIIFGLGACQQLCGSQTVIAYAQRIFEDVGFQYLDATEVTIILGVIQLITAGLSSSIVDRVGRRPLLLISTLGTGICSTVTGVYFFLNNKGQDVSAITWLPILTMMAFIIAYTIGLATVPFALVGEIFPANIKAIAASFYTITAAAINFGVLKLFQVISDSEAMGIHISFWLFAGFSYFFFVFVWILIPETKGKSLDRILEEINGLHKKSSS